MRNFSIVFLLISLGLSSSFAPSRVTDQSISTTRLFGNTKSPPTMPPLKDISYGEESRKYRRTVYTHDDWRKHRSPDRFFYYIRSLVKSGVYKNVAREVAATTIIATVLVAYNALTGGITDFDGVKHDALLPWLPMATLPLTSFTLSSPSLGLLLVFRTNTSYQRWDEARKNWGMNINHTRDLVRLGNSFYDSRGISEEKRKSDLQTLALCTWAFVRAMKRHLSPEDEDEEDFKKELYEKLPEAQATAIINAAHRPNRALQDLSVAIENLPMHFMRKNEIHKAVTIFEDNLGSSERLLTSPVPLFYSRHTARFLSVWLLLLPLALYEPFGNSWNHVGLIPATALISVFLFGIEELATQLEEPFTILPMQAFCDKIYNWCTEIVSWTAGDNGMVVREPRPEHTVAFTGSAPPVVKSAVSVSQDSPAPVSAGGDGSQEDEKSSSARKVEAAKVEIQWEAPEVSIKSNMLPTEEASMSASTPPPQESEYIATPSSTRQTEITSSESIIGPVVSAVGGALASGMQEGQPLQQTAVNAENSAPDLNWTVEDAEATETLATKAMDQTQYLETRVDEELILSTEKTIEQVVENGESVLTKQQGTADIPVAETTFSQQIDPSLSDPPPSSTEDEISTTVIDGAPYVDARGNGLLQPLFTENEYTTPVSNSFVGSGSSVPSDPSAMAEEDKVQKSSPPVASSRGLGSRGLRAVQRWKK